MPAPSGGVRLTLLTTSDAADPRAQAALQRYLTALGAVADPGSVRLVLLLQRCAPDGGSGLPLPPGATLLRTPVRLPLSQARNLMLDHWSRLPADRPEVIGFPDDDAWYPPGLVEGVLHRFAVDQGLGMWLCRYSPDPQPHQEGGVTARRDDVLRFASSNTMILRREVLEAAGRFDETLGLGTRLGGAEDVDLAVRAFPLAGRTEVTDLALVGHRAKTLAIRVRYLRSSVYVLRRHVPPAGIPRVVARVVADVLRPPG